MAMDYKLRVAWLILGMAALMGFIGLNRYQVSQKGGVFYRLDKITGAHTYKQFGKAGWDAEKAKILDGDHSTTKAGNSTKKWDFSDLEKIEGSGEGVTGVISDLFDETELESADYDDRPQYQAGAAHL